jgi:hypothetical protein
MTFKIRLSPSGPEIGTPGAQVGDSAVAGRIWGQTGVGSNTQVPGTLAGDVLGLENVVVDMKPSASGYTYDVEADTNTFGTGGLYRITVLGSTDSGSTFGVSLCTMNADFQTSGAGRLHHFSVSSGLAVINRVKMQLTRSIPAAADLTYAPVDSTLRITEVSPIS